jgi:hypothetical protein
MISYDLMLSGNYFFMRISMLSRLENIVLKAVGENVAISIKLGIESPLIVFTSFGT